MKLHPDDIEAIARIIQRERNPEAAAREVADWIEARSQQLEQGTPFEARETPTSRALKRALQEFEELQETSVAIGWPRSESLDQTLTEISEILKGKS